MAKSAREGPQRSAKSTGVPRRGPRARSLRARIPGSPASPARCVPSRAAWFCGGDTDIQRRGPATLQGGGLLHYIKALAVAAGLIVASGAPTASAAFAADAVAFAADAGPPLGVSQFDISISTRREQPSIVDGVLTCVDRTDECRALNENKWFDDATKSTFVPDIMNVVRTFGSGGYFAVTTGNAESTVSLNLDKALMMLNSMQVFSPLWGIKVKRAVALLHQNNSNILPTASVIDAVFAPILNLTRRRPQVAHAVQHAIQGYTQNWIMTRLLYEPDITFGIIALNMEDLRTEMLRPVLEHRAKAAAALMSLLENMRMSPNQLARNKSVVDEEYRTGFTLITALSNKRHDDITVLSNDDDRRRLESLVHEKVAMFSTNNDDAHVATPSIEELANHLEFLTDSKWHGTATFVEQRAAAYRTMNMSAEQESEILKAEAARFIFGDRDGNTTAETVYGLATLFGSKKGKLTRVDVENTTAVVFSPATELETERLYDFRQLLRTADNAVRRDLDGVFTSTQPAFTNEVEFIAFMMDALGLKEVDGTDAFVAMVNQLGANIVAHQIQEVALMQSAYNTVLTFIDKLYDMSSKILENFAYGAWAVLAFVLLVTVQTVVKTCAKCFGVASCCFRCRSNERSRSDSQCTVAGEDVADNASGAYDYFASLLTEQPKTSNIPIVKYKKGNFGIMVGGHYMQIFKKYYQAKSILSQRDAPPRVVVERELPPVRANDGGVVTLGNFNSWNINNGNWK